jgi:Flp pilus assembly pilin Flp
MKLSLFKKLARDQRGLSTMEYAVLFVIIVVGALTFWSKLGGKLTENLNEGTNKFGTELENSRKKTAEGTGDGT